MPLSTLDPYLLLGIFGMCGILVAFLMEQTHKWSQDALIYDLTNFMGSLFLVIYAFDGKAWPFFILNAIWAAYSLKDVLKRMTHDHRPMTNTL